jgi:hypothetical protein
MEVIGDIVQPSELIIRAMTTAERDAMANKEGLTIFNTTTNKLNFNTGSAWEAVTSG